MPHDTKRPKKVQAVCRPNYRLLSNILKQGLHQFQSGHLFLEFYIPRMGKRADALLIVDGIIFVVEFKIGAREHSRSALDQVEDYALDLKNFHEGTHSLPVVPILISTKAPSSELLPLTFADDRVAKPVATNASQFGVFIADNYDGAPVFRDRHHRVDGHWLQADTDDR
jgi:hypothetical protein